MHRLNVQQCLCGASNPNADRKAFVTHMKEAHGRNHKTWPHLENNKVYGPPLVRDGKIVKSASTPLKYPVPGAGADVTFTDADGEPRAGQVWSQAPHRGTWWVVPITHHVGESSALLVHFDREGNGRTWASR